MGRSHSEFIGIGRDAAARLIDASPFGESFLRDEIEIVRAKADELAKFAAVDAGSKSKVLKEAYRDTFMAAWRKQRNALPDIREARNVEDLRYEIEHDIKRGDAILAKFVKTLQNTTDPLYELAWSRTVFAAVANAKVAKEIAVDLDDHSWSDVREFTLQEALRFASQSKESTSPTSNLADTYKSEAWAEYARKFERQAKRS